MVYYVVELSEPRIQIFQRRLSSHRKVQDLSRFQIGPLLAASNVPLLHQARETLLLVNHFTHELLHHWVPCGTPRRWSTKKRPTRASTISVPIVVIVIPMAVANDWASRRCRFFGPLRTRSAQEMVAVEGLTLEGVRLLDFLPARAALLRLLWDCR